MIDFLRAQVPCAGCRQCCRGNSMVMLLEDEGDDVASYDHEIVELEAARIGPLAHKAGHGPILKRHPNGDCVYLGADGCTIHERAPIICRVFDCRNLVPGDPARSSVGFLRAGVFAPRHRQPGPQAGQEQQRMSAAAKGHALAACVRSASFHTPLIRSCTTRAANGPAKGAKHQLSEAIRHARALLFDLEKQQAELGWRERESQPA